MGGQIKNKIGILGAVVTTVTTVTTVTVSPVVRFPGIF